ncbi:MAG: aminopeptidase [Parabacteroides sp.]|nr:aminopeptidase [Parabacteroides sp.]
MKRIQSWIIIAWLLLLGPALYAGELDKALLRLPGLTRLDTLAPGEFKEKYVCFVRQPLDHRHPEKGSFNQRVVVCHAGFDRPTVFVTEGYGGAYALNPRYREELSRLFDTNVVVAEHRYFLESAPAPADWQYLTAENSAGDLHCIYEALHPVYPGKWISTGISKGGQTTLIYRTYYPDDMTLSVAYVAPLCRAAADGRHELFFRRIGTPGVRKKVHAFQLGLLKQREALMPLFEAYCRERNLAFRIPLPEVYDYCVLEYAFAFWQWGTPADAIPGKKASLRDRFDHFTAVSDPAYFALEQPNLPFFIQAAHELGYYGYDTAPFAGYLSITDCRDYLQRLFLPEGLVVPFKPDLHDRIVHFLEENDPKLICIYGGNDPWTAAAIPDMPHKRNRLILVQPGGSHLARIGTLPGKLKEKAVERITEWLNE